MISVISFTDNPKYDFFIPLIEWAWGKLGAKCHFIAPERIIGTPKFNLLEEYRIGWNLSTYSSPINKEITYSQVGRLFIGNMYAPKEEIVTSDADMILFKLPELNDDCFNIFGSDLVPKEQFPMCYAFAKADLWSKFLNKGKSLQENLDELFSGIECESFSGNYWSADQGHLWKSIIDYAGINLIPRARHGTQFASYRVDRTDTNWRSYLGPDLIDAHLWRPGYTDENFANIMELLTHQYPNENFQWLINYRNEYLKLL